jgi:Na+/H+-translocating membrane pyrophosphatase
LFFCISDEPVGKAAMVMVKRRRQFREFLELWKELVNRNMQIFLLRFTREMMLPGILTIDFIVVVLWETGLWGQQSISGRNA